MKFWLCSAGWTHPSDSRVSHRITISTQHKKHFKMDWTIRWPFWWPGDVCESAQFFGFSFWREEKRCSSTLQWFSSSSSFGPALKFTCICCYWCCNTYRWLFVLGIDSCSSRVQQRVSEIQYTPLHWSRLSDDVNNKCQKNFEFPVAKHPPMNEPSECVS